MNDPAPVISRLSICILSFALVQMGLTHRMSPPLAVNCVLAGTAGFIAYVGLKWSAFLRSRELVARLLIACGDTPR
jgi:hypothetical protein